MGTYRFLLALLVVLSHCQITIGGYNAGVAAVISFYILSGYYTSKLIARYYSHKAAIFDFYQDRLVRILPQFLFYALIYSGYIFYQSRIGVMQIAYLTKTDLSFGHHLLNLLLFPQAFYMFMGWEGAIVMPQSWSLGLEMTFYVIFPVMLWFGPRVVGALMGASFGVFALAYLGVIDTDYYGYRLLPGTLFIFLIGWSFAQRSKSSRWLRSVIIGVSAVLLAIASVVNQIGGRPWNKEVLWGIIVGTLTIAVLKQYKSHRFDLLLGGMSYGLFLNHIVFIWLMQAVVGRTALLPWEIAVMLGLSCGCAWASYHWLEQPVMQWRRQFRHRHKTPAEVN